MLLAAEINNVSEEIEELICDSHSLFSEIDIEDYTSLFTDYITKGIRKYYNEYNERINK